MARDLRGLISAGSRTRSDLSRGRCPSEPCPHRRSRGPGGWIILDGPELRFPDPASPGDVEVVQADLAGWRLERMPRLPEEEAFFTLAPDWICEVLSPSTAFVDRSEKMPLYACERVFHAWIIDPIARTLEVYRVANEGNPGLWTLLAVHGGNVKVHVEPFEAIELDLAAPWA